jgi:hypothetical protein
MSEGIVWHKKRCHQTNGALTSEVWHHSSMKKKGVSSKAQESTGTHKLGVNLHEPARRQRKLDKNFRQSRDVREDRGVRKLKTGPKTKGR